MFRRKDFSDILKGYSLYSSRNSGERFSYYGMRAILVFYMYYEVTDGGLGLDKTLALSIMSNYGSLVYMSGINGGWLADRIFGTSKAIFYGGVFIMLGHIALAIPGNITLFFISMVLIVIGTGLLKPNVSSVVGDVYPENDNRRDSGFSIFYMGINLGGFTAPLITGYLMDTSFHLAFGVAAVGMFIGLVVFLVTKKKNLGLAGTQVPNPLAREEKKKVFSIITIATIATRYSNRNRHPSRLANIRIFHRNCGYTWVPHPSRILFRNV